MARLVITASLTKLADILASAKTTLPWLCSAIGAPGWILPLLVPVRESGALLPQWLIKRSTVQYSDRLALWRAGILLQAGCLLTMAMVACLSAGVLAGVLILTLLTLLSLGRALASLTFKNIQAQRISKGQRGRLVGLASAIAGGLSIGSALLMMGKDGLNHGLLVGLIALAGLCFILALLPTLSFNVHIQANSDGPLWQAIKQSQPLRALIINRVLMLHSALAAPLIVGQSAAGQHNGVFMLPYFILAAALATLLASYAWGKLADKDARLCLRVAAVVCIMALLGVYVLNAVDTVMLLGFFLLSLGHAGVRTARKTYLLDIAQGAERTAFVASANTLVGLALLLLGGLYAALYSLIDKELILVMAATLTLGLVHTFTLAAEK